MKLATHWPNNKYYTATTNLTQPNKKTQMQQQTPHSPPKGNTDATKNTTQLQQQYTNWCDYKTYPTTTTSAATTTNYTPAPQVRKQKLHTCTTQETKAQVRKQKPHSNNYEHRTDANKKKTTQVRLRKHTQPHEQPTRNGNKEKQQRWNSQHTAAWTNTTQQQQQTPHRWNNKWERIGAERYDYKLPTPTRKPATTTNYTQVQEPAETTANNTLLHEQTLHRCSNKTYPPAWTKHTQRQQQNVPPNMNKTHRCSATTYATTSPKRCPAETRKPTQMHLQNIPTSMNKTHRNDYKKHSAPRTNTTPQDNYKTRLAATTNTKTRQWQH